MRHDRLDRYPWEWTSRKAAAVLRRQRREREAMPLFAAEVAARQPTVAEVEERRRLDWERRQVEQRKNRAASWRRARSRLAALPEAARALVKAWWQTSWAPADPVYLLDALTRAERGLQAEGALRASDWPVMQRPMRDG